MCVRCLPGETCADMCARVCRESDERRRFHMAEIEKRRAAGTLKQQVSTVPLSVGTFDCNGMPKGAGWH